MKKFNIPAYYKSSIIGEIKETRRLKDKLKKDFSPTVLDFGSVKIHIARHFGFCYGVENAVEIAYRTLEEHPNKRIFLLSEMIHNPEVNEDLKSRGVKFLMDTNANQLIAWEELNKEDVVIVPAFGTTLEIQEKLNQQGINPYAFDTTCPFVEKVWNRSQQIGDRGYTVIIHGKPNHEETRATFSHSLSKAPTIVIKDLNQAKKLVPYITGVGKITDFQKEFGHQCSDGFDPNKDLKKIGVVNQTTMLASETQEITDFFRNTIASHFKLKGDELSNYFANTRDTLCYATNDNQEATNTLLKSKADLALVVGGYNSSNTSHLVELCEKELTTFFINSEQNLNDQNLIEHFNLSLNEIQRTKAYIPKKEIVNILLTCGASCPDAVMERVLLKLLTFFNNISPIQDVLKEIKRR